MTYILKLLYPFSLIHFLVYLFLPNNIRKDIDEDIAYMNQRYKKNSSLMTYLIYNKPYRNLFYYRIGKRAFLLRFLLWEYPMFIIRVREFAGGAFVVNHPYSSIINAKKIGKNFTICQCTTIGNKIHGRNDLVPTIGDNVMLGANVCILGDITIGNNVVIAAGSVVIHDVPDDCMVAGNPAVIKKNCGNKVVDSDLF